MSWIWPFLVLVAALTLWTVLCCVWFGFDLSRFL